MGRKGPNSHAAARKRGFDTFFALPHRIINSEEYWNLSRSAFKLLHLLCSRYRGNNNGNLSLTAHEWLDKAGEKSRVTYRAAQKELIDKGFICLTRKGGLNRGSNRFALTFYSIDDCKVKYDPGIIVGVAPSDPWHACNTRKMLQ